MLECREKRRWRNESPTVAKESFHGVLMGVEGEKQNYGASWTGLDRKKKRHSSMELTEVLQRVQRLMMAGTLSEENDQTPHH